MDSGSVARSNACASSVLIGAAFGPLFAVTEYTYAVCKRYDS
jgi:hypothetical protein